MEGTEMEDKAEENKKSADDVHTRRTSVRRYASRVFQESSVGMVSSLAHTGSSKRRIYKVLALIACLTGFLYQTGQFLAVFFQYPTSVDIDIARPEWLTMPGFTFCDNNGINRKIFCQKFPDRCEEPDEAFCKKFEYYCDENRSLVPKKEFYSLAHGLNLEEMVELNVNDTDFVQTTDTSMYGEEVSKPFLRRRDFLSPNFICYGIHDRVNSPNLPRQAKQNEFFRQPMEIMHFTVQPDAVFVPGTRPGILFAIHSAFEAVDPFQTGIFMKPGRSYMVFVSMEEEILQQAPYDTECVNYTEIWMKNDYSGPRLQDMCKQNCIADLSIQCFNCVVPFIQYPRDERYCQTEDINPENCPDEKMKVPVNECHSKCRNDCRRVKYSYTVQERFSKKFDENGEMIDNLENSITVEVFLEGDEVIVLKHSPKYMIVEVFSNIGGFIGCWLGINLLDITDIFEGFFRIFRYSFKR